jgi:hypothetical protein
MKMKMKIHVRYQNVGEIGGASGGGAKFAENRNDKIVGQGVEQVTLPGDLRRFSVPLAARHVLPGRISPPLHYYSVLRRHTDVSSPSHHSRITKPPPRSHSLSLLRVLLISLRSKERKKAE